jgi:hypothetical protein
MATITEIHSLRITISDPPDIIKITIVATVDDLPAEPTPQTVYYVTADGTYRKTDKSSGAGSVNYYYFPELYLSDEVIEALIDTHGTTKAVYKSLKLIASKLASQLPVVRSVSGTSSTQYIELNELYKYYKNIIADFIEEDNQNNTGRIGSMENPEIAGGNI